MGARITLSGNTKERPGQLFLLRFKFSKLLTLAVNSCKAGTESFFSGPGSVLHFKKIGLRAAPAPAPVPQPGYATRVLSLKNQHWPLIDLGVRLEGITCLSSLIPPPSPNRSRHRPTDFHLLCCLHTAVLIWASRSKGSKVLFPIQNLIQRPWADFLLAISVSKNELE